MLAVHFMNPSPSQPLPRAGSLEPPTLDLWTVVGGALVGARFRQGRDWEASIAHQSWGDDG